MATFEHPDTGVILNVITKRRSSLNPIEVETVRALASTGEDQHIIAAMLGINQGRINDVMGPRSSNAPEEPDLFSRD